MKAYCNVKVNGYREAVEASEQCKTTVDIHTIQTWSWADAAVADSKPHDMLLLVAGADALGIVEGVPDQDFEAWRLFNERFFALARCTRTTG